MIEKKMKTLTQLLNESINLSEKTAKFASIESIDAYNYMVVDGSTGDAKLYAALDDLLSDWNQDSEWFDSKKAKALKAGQTLTDQENTDSYIIRLF